MSVATQTEVLKFYKSPTTPLANAHKIWNELPNNVRNLTTIVSFRKKAHNLSLLKSLSPHSHPASPVSSQELT